MERGQTHEEAAKTSADATPAFLAGHSAARADLLMLLRIAFADGPVGGPARAALHRAARILGMSEEQVGLVMEPLERADTASALPFAGLSAEHRVGLLRQALEVAAHDPELVARGNRLRARLMVLLDLSPDDMPDPETA